MLSNTSTRTGFFILALVYLFCLESSNAKRNKLLLLSFDGFRWDYIDKYDTPNFHNFVKEGVFAPLGIRPAFTTKTFPNHYTLVTGLWEESHGIINNRMYDPLFNATFKPGNNETRWWDGGEPIWITAKLKGRKSAVYFWPGSETKLKGIYPDYYVPYKKDAPFESRLETAMDWLSKENVDIVCVYFHEPDGAGHTCGAFGSCVKDAVTRMDNILGKTVEKLQRNNLFNNTNLIVVSDHGMTNITADEEHIIVLADYLDMAAEVELVTQDGVVAMILPKTGMDDIIVKKLKAANRKMTVYKKEDIPEHFHYKNHRRIMPIVIAADEGYIVKTERPVDLSRIGPGEHGYDNDLSAMKPIFFARGPSFIPGKTLATFDNINVYSLLCHLLEIEPAPNNGSVDTFKHVLINRGNNLNTPCISMVYFAILVLVYQVIT